MYSYKKKRKKKKNSYCHLSKFTVYRINKYQDPEKRRKNVHRIGGFFSRLQTKNIANIEKRKKKKPRSNIWERFSSWRWHIHRYSRRNWSCLDGEYIQSYRRIENFSFSFCDIGGSHSNDASIRARMRKSLQRHVRWYSSLTIFFECWWCNDVINNYIISFEGTLEYMFE